MHLCGNVAVDIKHEKLGDKLQTRPPMRKFAQAHDLVSQAICLEGRLFTFKKSNFPSQQSNQCTQTSFRMLIVGY